MEKQLMEALYSASFVAKVLRVGYACAILFKDHNTENKNPY